MRVALTNSGFTLIELLIVISIIAILSTIGIATYNTAQSSARDGRRRQEITQIAKSIEISKDAGTGIYTYTSTDFNNDFGRNGSTQLSSYSDPQSIVYCILTSTATGVSTTPPADWTGATCPGSYVKLSVSVTLPGTPVANNLYNNDVKSWVLCSHLERTTTPFCVNSSQ